MQSPLRRFFRRARNGRRNKKSAAIALAVAYVDDMDLTGPLDAKDWARLQFVCDLSVIQYPEYRGTIVTACDAIKGDAA